MKYLIVTLLFLTFTNTCNTKNAKTASNQEKQIEAQQRVKFLITSLNGKNVAKENLHITIDEERNSISGYSGCNTFSSTYTAEKNSISIGFPMASKMHCEKKVALEDEFFKALSEVNIKNIIKDSLFLKDRNGTVLFTGIVLNE